MREHALVVLLLLRLVMVVLHLQRVQVMVGRRELGQLVVVLVLVDVVRLRLAGRKVVRLLVLVLLLLLLLTVKLVLLLVLVLMVVVQLGVKVVVGLVVHGRVLVGARHAQLALARLLLELVLAVEGLLLQLGRLLQLHLHWQLQLQVGGRLLLLLLLGQVGLLLVEAGGGKVGVVVRVGARKIRLDVQLWLQVCAQLVAVAAVAAAAIARCVDAATSGESVQGATIARGDIAARLLWLVQLLTGAARLLLGLNGRPVGASNGRGQLLGRLLGARSLLAGNVVNVHLIGALEFAQKEVLLAEGQCDFLEPLCKRSHLVVYGGQH